MHEDLRTTTNVLLASLHDPDDLPPGGPDDETGPVDDSAPFHPRPDTPGNYDGKP